MLDQKSNHNISIYDVAYKTSCGAKPLCFILDKVIGYIRKNNRTKFLALFHSDEKYEKILDIGRDFIMLKISISDVYSHKYTKVMIIYL